jgi:lysophospholipase L1-like esterase
MSEQKLTNYLNNSTFSTPIGPRHHIPVMLSDSKGIYLKNNIIHPFDNNIVWWCKGGSTIEKSLAWLEHNIDAKLRTLGPIRLYIWLGTCNLKRKGKTPHIALTSNNDDSVKHIIRNLNNFKEFLANYHQVQVIFLEIPVYSIVSWNRYHHHIDPTDFKEQDRDLQQQISKVNQEIRQRNSDLQTNSPDFSKFLKASARHRRRSQRDTWHYYNFKLYKDGVHPTQKLARVWLREIVDRIREACWSLK